MALMSGRTSRANGARGLALPPAWRKLIAEGVAEGGRNNALTRLAGSLLHSGQNPYLALDLVRLWNAARCRPPLNDDEVVRIVDSIAGRELEAKMNGNGRR
jgi:hypothetical protein